VNLPVVVISVTEVAHCLKPCGLRRFYAVSYGKNHVKRIEHNRFVRIWNLHILQIAFFGKLTLCKNVLDIA
jgi:hypothetical protein